MISLTKPRLVWSTGYFKSMYTSLSPPPTPAFLLVSLLWLYKSDAQGCVIAISPALLIYFFQVLADSSFNSTILLSSQPLQNKQSIHSRFFPSPFSISPLFLPRFLRLPQIQPPASAFFPLVLQILLLGFPRTLFYHATKQPSYDSL